MLDFVVLVAARGRLHPSVVERVAAEDLPEVHFAPEERTVWSNAPGSVLFCGWQAAADHAGAGSHWHVDAHGLTAFCGLPSPRGSAWPAGAATAERLAEDCRAMRGRELFERYHGSYTIVHLPARADGLLFADPLGTSPLYRAQSRRIAALSNRAGLAARAVAGRRPTSRDVETVGWLPFCGHVVGSGTGYRGVRTLPQASVVRIRPRGGDTVERWSRHVWHRPQEAASEPDAVARVAEDLEDHLVGLLRLPVGERTVRLSGGKDARVLLAVLVATECADQLGYEVDGPEDDPDVTVVRQLAEAFDLGEVAVRTPESQLDATEFIRRARSSAYLTEGMLTSAALTSAPSLNGGTLEPGMTLDGDYGTLARSHDVGGVSLTTPRDARRFFAQRMPFDAAQILRPEALHHYRQAVKRWLAQQLDAGVGPADTPDVFALQHRARNRVGVHQQATLALQGHPLLSLELVRTAFAMGVEARRRDALHFALIRRLCEPLLAAPLAGTRWDPSLYGDVPEALRLAVSAARPVTRGRRSKSGGRARPYDRLKPALLDAVVDDASNPLFDIVARSALQRLLTRDRGLGASARLSVYSTLGAAIWLGQGETAMRASRHGPQPGPPTVG